MKKTLENKAKLFAQYWGQLVHFHTTTNTYSHVKSLYFTDHCLRDQNFILQLKSISSITDEDAKSICSEIGLPMAEKLFIGETLISYIDDSYTVRFYFDGFVTVHKHDKISLSDTFRCTDLAKSKGYALPYVGLSVEKQIEYGWIKLS